MVSSISLFLIFAGSLQMCPKNRVLSTEFVELTSQNSVTFYYNDPTLQKQFLLLSAPFALHVAKKGNDYYLACESGYELNDDYYQLFFKDELKLFVPCEESGMAFPKELDDEDIYSLLQTEKGTYIKMFSDIVYSMIKFAYNLKDDKRINNIYQKGDYCMKLIEDKPIGKDVDAIDFDLYLTFNGKKDLRLLNSFIPEQKGINFEVFKSILAQELLLFSHCMILRSHIEVSGAFDVATHEFFGFNLENLLREKQAYGVFFNTLLKAYDINVAMKHKLGQNGNTFLKMKFAEAVSVNKGVCSMKKDLFQDEEFSQFLVFLEKMNLDINTNPKVTANRLKELDEKLKARLDSLPVKWESEFEKPVNTPKIEQPTKKEVQMVGDPLKEAKPNSSFKIAIFFVIVAGFAVFTVFGILAIIH